MYNMTETRVFTGLKTVEKAIAKTMRGFKAAIEYAH